MTIVSGYARLVLISVGIAMSTGALSAQVNQMPGSGIIAGSVAASRPAKGKVDVPEIHPYRTAVRDGILTVDGMVGKAQLNYNVDQHFLYFTVPGVGTAIVAQQRFMNALPQKDAFHGSVLTIQVNGHTVELTNSGPLVAGKTAEAWVAIDPLYGAGIPFPQMGFGDTIARPYVWPGAKSTKPEKNSVTAIAPPLPVSVRPKPEIASSYTVTVPGTETAGAKQ